MLVDEPRDARHRTGIWQYADQVAKGLAALGVDVRRVDMGNREFRLGPLRLGGRLSIEYNRLLKPLPRAAVRHATHVQVLHRRANVLTIQDLTWFKRPEQYGTQPAIFRRSRKRVEALPLVFTISEAVRQDAINLLGLDPKRLKVTHLAPDHTTYFRTDDQPTGTPYFLFVGDVRPRKRLEWVLQAMRDERLAHARLVRCGPPWGDKGYAAQCRQAAAPLGPRLEDAGYVEGEAMRRLYAGAAALVYPSEDEGFGIPPLEAAACGTQSVLTPLPVFQETLGPLAHTMRAHSVDALADAMAEALRRRLPRAELAARARQFTWNACARATLDGYHAAGLL